MNAPQRFTAHAVLGSLLSGEPLGQRDIERLTPELFPEQHDRMIFEAWRYQAANGGATDPVGVLERLRDLGRLDAAGGQAYVLGLVDELASAANFGAHVDRLVDERARERLAGIADRTRERLDLGHSPASVAADMLQALGMLDSASLAPARGRGLQALPLAEIRLDIASRYVVKGILSRDSLAIVVGPPGSGKTFLVADLALSVSAGLAWREHRVHRGSVLYLAAENPRSLQNRALAWCDHHQVAKGLPFYIASSSLSLRDDAARVVDLAHAIESETGEPVQLIVVDTLSRAFGAGDENSAADMGAVVVACDLIRRGTEACIVLVHHSGKDASRGARGSSALEAAADTVLAVQDKVATAVKQRDGETGAAMPFKLLAVQLGDDEDGDPVSTCVVEHDQAPGRDQGAARRPKLSPAEENALAALHEVLSDKTMCRTAPAALIEYGAHVGQDITTIESWRQRCYARMGDMPQDTKRKQFLRVQEGLQAKGRIQRFEGDIWLA